MKYDVCAMSLLEAADRNGAVSIITDTERQQQRMGVQRRVGTYLGRDAGST